MYYNSDDKQQFIEGELVGLRAARDSAIATALLTKGAWARAQSDAQRARFSGDENAEKLVYATRERFRAAHREAAALKDEVAGVEYDLGYDGYEDEDLDEYVYAA